MMSVDVDARNHGYRSTIGTYSPRPLTVGVRIGRTRIQFGSDTDFISRSGKFHEANFMPFSANFTHISPEIS